MAQLLWGRVYYDGLFAGIISAEPGERFVFTYDTGYVEGGHPPLAHTLPMQSEAHISTYGLHPFFDNLVAEGWLEHAQSRLLGRRSVSRFELLLAFGFDCAGAVSIIDPEPSTISTALLDLNDPKEMAALASRASLSGVQPKLAVVADGGGFRPAGKGALSTHIAKFPSSTHPDLIQNEYLTMLAFQALLPDDATVEATIEEIDGIDTPALVVKRFDRHNDGHNGGRIHFEEFNQLLGKPSAAKYDGTYTDMADFIRTHDAAIPAEIYRLYRRILAGILLGNSDMHLKNFALFHNGEGLRLTPSYDQVAAVLYEYKHLALGLAGAENRKLGTLKPRHLIMLGEDFGLPLAAIAMAAQGLKKNMVAAKDAINDAPFATARLKDNLIEWMERRWNGSFALIGTTLSARQ